MTTTTETTRRDPTLPELDGVVLSTGYHGDHFVVTAHYTGEWDAEADAWTTPDGSFVDAAELWRQVDAALKPSLLEPQFSGSDDADPASEWVAYRETP